jgi:hypothetical protein
MTNKLFLFLNSIVMNIAQPIWTDPLNPVIQPENKQYVNWRRNIVKSQAKYFDEINPYRFTVAQGKRAVSTGMTYVPMKKYRKFLAPHYDYDRLPQFNNPSSIKYQSGSGFWDVARQYAQDLGLTIEEPSTSIVNKSSMDSMAYDEADDQDMEGGVIYYDKSSPSSFDKFMAQYMAEHPKPRGVSEEKYRGVATQIYASLPRQPQETIKNAYDINQTSHLRNDRFLGQDESYGMSRNQYDQIEANRKKLINKLDNRQEEMDYNGIMNESNRVVFSDQDQAINRTEIIKNRIKAKSNLETLNLIQRLSRDQPAYTSTLQKLLAQDAKKRKNLNIQQDIDIKAKIITQFPNIIQDKKEKLKAINPHITDHEVLEDIYKIPIDEFVMETSKYTKLVPPFNQIDVVEAVRKALDLTSEFNKLQTEFELKKKESDMYKNDIEQLNIELKDANEYIDRQSNLFDELDAKYKSADTSDIEKDDILAKMEEVTKAIEDKKTDIVEIKGMLKDTIIDKDHLDKTVIPTIEKKKEVIDDEYSKKIKDVEPTLSVIKDPIIHHIDQLLATGKKIIATDNDFQNFADYSKNLLDNPSDQDNIFKLQSTIDNLFKYGYTTNFPSTNKSDAHYEIMKSFLKKFGFDTTSLKKGSITSTFIDVNGKLNEISSIMGFLEKVPEIKDIEKLIYIFNEARNNKFTSLEELDKKINTGPIVTSSSSSIVPSLSEADSQQIEQEKAEQDAEQLKADEEKAKQLKAEQEAEQLKAEQEKAKQLKAEQEAEQLKAEQLKAEQLKAEQLKAEQEKAEKEKAEKEKAEKERLEKKNLSIEKIDTLIKLPDFNNPIQDIVGKFTDPNIMKDLIKTSNRNEVNKIITHLYATPIIDSIPILDNIDDTINNLLLLFTQPGKKQIIFDTINNGIDNFYLRDLKKYLNKKELTDDDKTKILDGIKTLNWILSYKKRLAPLVPDILFGIGNTKQQISSLEERVQKSIEKPKEGSGLTKKTKIPKKIKVPLKRHELSQYGYKDVKDLPVDERHKILNLAMDDWFKGDVGKLSLFRKLNALYVVNKKRNPELAEIFIADRDYVKSIPSH